MEQKKVLIIDDETFIRELLIDFFATHSIQCDEASDADSATEKIRSGEYNLVLLDFHLEGEKADELARDIKTLKPNVPILVMTGSSDMTLSDVQDYGVDDIIHKPFDFGNLFTIINRFLENQ